MSRDSGADGVQVVGGSNPPCPTNYFLPINPYSSFFVFGPIGVGGTTENGSFCIRASAA